jgi:hypothetical protein
MDGTAHEIRHDIEQARARVGAAMGAVGYRADMPGRLRDRVSHLASRTQAESSTETSTWSTVRSFAKANALALGLGAFAVGVIAGMFVPRGKIQRQRIAPLATEIRHRAVQTGEKVIERSRQMARSPWAA